MTNPTNGFLELCVASIEPLFQQMSDGLTMEPIEPLGDPGAFGLMIGVSGSINGSVAIRCSDETALSIAQAFAQTNSPRVPDAMGEVLNIAVGNAKAKSPGDSRITPPQPFDEGAFGSAVERLCLESSLGVITFEACLETAPVGSAAAEG